MPVYGSPEGATDALVAQFGDRAGAGAAGERHTSELLDGAYAGSAHTWVFHNVRMPGWKKANLDHVVVRGSIVVVLDSKFWKPGTYWRPPGGPRRGLKPFRPAEHIYLAEMAGRFAARLGAPAATVRPLVVVWPSRPGQLTLWRWPYGLRVDGGVPVVLGSDLLRRLVPALGPATARPRLELVDALVAVSGRTRR